MSILELKKLIKLILCKWAKGDVIPVTGDGYP
jgi:hypothetical protein